MGEHLISADNRDNDEEIKKTRESRSDKEHCSPSSLRFLIFIPTSLGLADQRARVSSLVTGFTLVCLLIFGLFRPSLAVPAKMQHHHQRAEPLEAHENSDNTLLHDDELENIRKSIMEGLGLDRIPDPLKANVSQAEYERAHEEYLRRLQMSRAPGDRRRKRLHTFQVSEETSITTRRRRQLVRNPENNHRLFFRMKISGEGVIIDHANLRLLLSSDSHQDLVNVAVYRLTNSSKHLVTINSIKRLEGPRWIELDITDTATLWHESSADNLGLELSLESVSGANIAFSSPILNVFTTSNSRGFRRRRSSLDGATSLHKGRKTDCKSGNKKCCRHEMTVIFKDLQGFEFIIQPKNFDAGYCKGRCPPSYNPAHHHALLQSLIWREDKRKVPKPCCAPSKLEELEILYFDEYDPTKLKVTTWKNMKVLECACS